MLRARCVDVFEEDLLMPRLVPLQSEAKPLTLWGCLLIFDILISKK